MDIKRINSIVNNKEKFNVYYDNRQVWIQEVNNNSNMAKVGFIDTFEEQDILINNLYEDIKKY